MRTVPNGARRQARGHHQGRARVSFGERGGNGTRATLRGRVRGYDRGGRCFHWQLCRVSGRGGLLLGGRGGTGTLATLRGAVGDYDGGGRGFLGRFGGFSGGGSSGEGAPCWGKPFAGPSHPKGGPAEIFLDPGGFEKEWQK